MRKFAQAMMPLAAAAMLASCLNQSGSVSSDAVAEMLASPKLAVTPFQPIWLNEGDEEIWALSDAERTKVCALLETGESRHVPELAYQTDDERNPLAQRRFYIYASNGQCLGGTLLDGRVVMHDVVLQPEQEQELYNILKPYLKKVFAK